MTVFKFHEAVVDSIHVDTADEGAEIRFDENTLGFKPSANHDGYSITNDWNNRHFTIGFGEGSILYHITREDIDDRKSGSGDLPREEFVAEMYGYVRSLAYPIEEDYVDYEIVGRFDLSATKEYMKEQGVVEYTSSGLTVDNTRENELIDELEENPTKLGEVYMKILDPISFDEIRDCDDIVFVVPLYDRIVLVFLYPNNYVGVVKARDLFERLTDGGGSQIIDHVFRSVATD